MTSNRTGSAIVYFHAAQNIPPSNCLLAVPAESIQLTGPDAVFSENHVCSVLVDGVVYPCLIIDIDEDLTVDSMMLELSNPEKKLKFQKKAIRWSHDHSLKQVLSSPKKSANAQFSGQGTSREQSNGSQLENENVDKWDPEVLAFIIPETLTGTDGKKIDLETFFDDLSNGDGKWQSALTFAVKKIFTVEEFLNSVSSPPDLIMENFAELSLSQKKFLSLYSVFLHFCEKKNIPRDQTGQQTVIQFVNRLRNQIRTSTLTSTILP